MKQSLGSAIKNQRKKLHLSTVALARQLDMNRGYIHKIENQAFLPSPKIIEKISSELKCPSLVKLYFVEKRKTLAKTEAATIKKLKG